MDEVLDFGGAGVDVVGVSEGSWIEFRAAAADREGSDVRRTETELRDAALAASGLVMLRGLTPERGGLAPSGKERLSVTHRQ